MRGEVLSVSRLLRYPGSADEYATRTMSYWPNGKLYTAVDETGRVLTTAYETTTGFSLFPLSVTNGAGEATSYTWDVACAAARTQTDANAQTATTTYDALCRPVRTDLPLGGYVVRSQPDLGNPSGQRTRTDAPPPPGQTGSSWTEVYFDGLGRPWKTVSRGPTGSADIVAEQSYGIRGLLAEVTEPRYENGPERVTSYEYDGLGRVVRVELPGSREVLTSYEATSQTATDPDGKQATSRFDAYGRVIEVERSLNSQPVITETRYDALGRRIGMTDPAGIEWTWAFDSLGRLREEWDPDAGHRVYAYDKAGRPLTQTDAKGQTTTLAYDAPVGRLQTRSNPSGTVSFTYGQARSGFFNTGHLTRVVSPSDVLELDYDALGRAVEQRRTLDAVTYTVEKDFDPSGYRLATTYPDGDVVGDLTYDGSGRLAAIPGIATAITYDAMGRALSRQNANTTQTTWSYADSRGFLTQIQTSGAQGTVQDLQYSQYTDAGLLGQVTSPISGEGWSYAYDDLGHMTTATHLQNPADSQSFTYDGADRILTSSRYGAYSYPSTAQAHPHSPDSVNGTPLTYDLNGNVTQAGTRSLVWNADNLPTQVTLGSLTTAFSYDGQGERLKKSSSMGTSRYPFGDDYEITDGVVTKYISAEGLGPIAKRVGYGPSAVTYFLHADRLGSIQAVTSDGSDQQYPAGTVVSRRTFRPFGETLGQSGPHTESRGWIDQRNDPETGLTYLHARYFDPQLGVFLSPDPIGVAGGMNQYAYGFGDPVNWSDASGLDPDFVFCAPYTNCSRPGGGGGGGGGFSFGVNPNSSGDLGQLFRDIGKGLQAVGCFLFGPCGPQAPSSQGAPHPSTEVEFGSLRTEFDRPGSGGDNSPAQPALVVGSPVIIGAPQGPEPGGGTGGGSGGGPSGGERSPIGPYSQPPVFDWLGGATSSVFDSGYSVGLGAVGSVDYLFSGDATLALEAWELGPLGQTDGAGWYGTWTRGSLGLSEAAMSGVVGGYGLRGLSALSRARHFRWLNHNRYVRIGQSHFPGRGAPGASRHVPQVRIGTGKRWWSHWRLP